MSRGMAARVRELSAGRVPFVHATVVRAQVPDLGQGRRRRGRAARRHDRGVRRRAVRREVGADGGARRTAGRRDRAAAGAARRQRAVPGLAGRAGGGQPLPVRRGAGDLPAADAAGTAASRSSATPRWPTRWSGSPRCWTTRPRGRCPARARRTRPRSWSPATAGTSTRRSGWRWRPASPTSRCVASRRRGAAVLDELDLTPEQRARISTPAGLDIGARTARRGGAVHPGRGDRDAALGRAVGRGPADRADRRR